MHIWTFVFAPAHHEIVLTFRFGIVRLNFLNTIYMQDISDFACYEEAIFWKVIYAVFSLILNYGNASQLR